MIKAKVFKYVKSFEGPPEETNFEMVEEELPPLKEEEFLTEALFLSVDPYMRAYAPHLKIGTTFIGEQVARIIESKNSNFPVGKLVVGPFGWRSHTISDGGSVKDSPLSEPSLVPDIGNLSPSLCIGILGMPGTTAYLGFYKLQRPKSGETLVVSGAAGAVGSVVGQLGKLACCRVIGIAGSDEKGKWLVNELGFDNFINYKKSEVGKELSRLAPQGIDIYYDNVGGETSNAVLQNMNVFGRITVCGLISEYNNKTITYGYNASPVLFKQLKIQGFLIWSHKDQFCEARSQMKKWIENGDIKYKETITEGFENLPKAFIDMMEGGNYGKALVKI